VIVSSDDEEVASVVSDVIFPSAPSVAVSFQVVPVAVAVPTVVPPSFSVACTS